MTKSNAQPAPAANPAPVTGKEATPPSILPDDVCFIEKGKEQSSPVTLNRPPLGETREAELQPGQEYIFGFKKSETISFVQEGNDLIVTFNCGGKLVLHNYAQAVSGSEAATFAFADLISQGELTNLIQVVETKQEEEEVQGQLRKGEKRAENDNAQGEDVANIEPASGDQNNVAKNLANIEPAAGDTATGNQNSGYGFNSSVDVTPQGPLSAIGPIGATALRYDARFPEPLPFIPEEQDFDPSLEVDPQFLDETNLSGGPLAVTGIIHAAFGEDGPGIITPDGTFSSTGSQTGGILSSGGVPITVTPTVDGYIGTAGGVTVFTLVIDQATGEYTFTQFAPIDHADGTDPNDAITLLFGVQAEDNDGDVSATTLSITIADDAPLVAAPMSETIDEGDLTGGPVSVSDTLTIDFGQDQPGHVDPSGAVSVSGDLAGGILSSGGVPVTIAPTANGYEGTAGGTTVFTITINPLTGAYTFTLLAPLDHSNPGDTITIDFGVDITDYDGDTAQSLITINIVDDVPHISDTPGIGSGIENVDETNLGPIAVGGNLVVDFGTDLPSAVTTTGGFTATGSLAGGVLTSHGVPVDIISSQTGYIGVAGGATVFNLSVNSAGAYVFTLEGVLDHADTANPDDVITLQFGVQVTDSDGDTDTGFITVNVNDDGPSIVAPAAETINEHDLVGGPVVITDSVAFDFGHDGAGAVGVNGVANASGDLANGKLSSGGVPVTILETGTGYIGTTGGGTPVFILNIDPVTGQYSFTLNGPLDHDTAGDTITLDFGITVTDYDGDTVSSLITVNVTDDRPSFGQPDIGSGIEIVDETYLGPTTVGGHLVVNAGADTPAAVTTTGVFTPGGSLAGGALTSHGIPVTILTSSTGYIGVAGGTTVFSLAINNAGAYVFTQYAVLDHGNPADHDDAITLNFGVQVTDSDGDAALGSITVHVKDDGPSIESPIAQSMDESDIGTVALLGLLSGNFGQDGPGAFAPNGIAGATGDLAGGTLSSGGVPVVIATTANGYIGTAGGATVFEVIIDSATGNYSFVLSKPLDHDGDVITLSFGAQIKDYDGDTANAAIVINITDDVPSFPGTPDIGSGIEVVDETNLGPITVGGNLVVSSGSDVPVAVTATGAFTPGGSLAGGTLTSGGIPVTIVSGPGGYIGMAGGTAVFTLSVNTAGAYSFTLHGTLDHADTSNPDDVITLRFGVQVTDSDGDSAPGSILINVHDDGPVAHDDFNTFDHDDHMAVGNVITGLNGGPGAADDLSNDNDNTVTAVSFNGSTVNVPAVGTASIDGDFGTLTISADGSYTYVPHAMGGGDFHHFAGGAAFPDMDESEALDAAEQLALGVAPGNLDVNGGDTINVSFISEGASYNNTLGAFTVAPDGTLHVVQVLIPNGNNVIAGENFNLTAGTGDAQVGFFLLADGSTLNGSYAGIDFSAGHLDFVYDYGLPTERPAQISDDGTHVQLVYTSAGNVETVLNGPLYFTTERGSPDNLNADDSVRVVSAIAPGGDNTVLRVGFEDLPNLGDNDFNDIVFDVRIRSAGQECGTDVFTYTLTDGDGDSSQATLTLECFDDDTPIVVAPPAKAVDETDLGPLVVHGTVNADFQDDGPGTITPNGLFSSTGSKLGGNLTSDGIPVVVSEIPGGYVGTAGGTTVFTLTVNGATGAYTFTLNGVLDHADGANPNDVIRLNFGVTATDTDGDSSNTTIAIDVIDDAPVAHNDTNCFDVQTTNKDFNIVLILDVSGSMLGNKIALLKSSVANLLGDFNAYNGGEIKVHIVPFSSSAQTAQTFTVTTDGDYNAALTFLDGLSASGTTNYESPMQSAINWLNGASVNDPIAGADTYTYFVSDGEPNRYVDTSGTSVDGTAARVMEEITGTNATDNVSEVDLLQGLSTKVISVGIGVSATTLARLDVIDSDGAALDVQDPNDLDAAFQSTNPLVGIATGNVITGLNGGTGAADNLSNDLDNTVTQVSFNGTNVAVDPVTGATIDGQNGTLKIHADGSYTYTLFNPPVNLPLNGALGDVFTYRLTDGDGDNSTATLTLKGKLDLNVDITVNNGADSVCVKEDGLVDVPVTATYTGGDGDEVMTLTLTGVQPGWALTAMGWTNNGGGVYTMTLPGGQTTFNGILTFAPPHNSDVDMSGLNVTVSVVDPGAGVTKTDSDGFAIHVDAVVDTPDLAVPISVGPQPWYYVNSHYVVPLAISSNVTDTDGSEIITKIVIDLSNSFNGGVAPYFTLDDMGIGLNKGTEIFPGIWEIPVNSGDATAALSGLSLIVPDNFNFGVLHQSATGWHTANIVVKSYVSEAYLSGEECDYSDNSTVVVKSFPLTFYITPLALDLDGNGIDLINQSAGVLFDMNNNGTLDHTSWVGPKDGLLTIDLNHDGLINNQSELFGNSDTADNGFANLAQYDGNGDGVIDSRDTVFSSLLVWQDANTDGVSQTAELHTLADAGITAINLNATQTAYAVGDSVVSHESTFVYDNGETGTIVDAWFSVRDGAAAEVAQTLNGTNQNDIILGSEGKDVISGGAGNDVLYGNGGDDIFVAGPASDGIDTIRDFHIGDVLDVSGLLNGYDPVQDSINDFVFKTESEGNTTILVNQNGTGGVESAAAVAVLEGVTGLSIDQITRSGEHTTV